jgi:hypothetical protein
MLLGMLLRKKLVKAQKDNMKPSDFLTELSNEKLAQYKTAAGADASKADSEGDFKRGNKRFSGIVKATKKQFANDEKKVQEGVGLPSPGTYEETNDMFKSSGQRRIGSLTTEDEQIDGMAQGEIREIIKNAIHIKNQLDKGVSLDGWMYSYVTTSNDHLNSVAEQINNPNIEEQGVAEEWSQKYKSSINCSNPKGFSQKAHCAGKKKHNEDMSEEKKPDFMKAGNMKPFKASGEEIPGAVHALEKLLLKAKEQGVKLNYTNIDKIMQSVCKKHNLTGDELHNEFVSKHHMIPDNWIVKQLDEACWKGYHKEGNKKMFGKTYPNCVKNEGVAEGSESKKFYTDKKQWLRDVDDINHSVHSDESDYLGDTGRSTITINGREWARWSDAQQKGYIDMSSMSEQGVAEEQHSCPHCGGEMVSEELMNEKKDACYYKVKSRYKVWPSAYASGALVKCRKKGADSWGNGGKKNESSILEGIERADESLHDWFTKEKWVRMDTKGNIKGPCAKEPGEGKPKCLPQSKAHNLGKKGRASAAARKRREDPNPDRHGKAINVNTKKETKG